MYLFVYGTLMKERSNHKEYLSAAAFVSSACIYDYGLYCFGEYPAIIPEKGESVAGEVYEITSEDVVQLDELEEEGILYQRALLPVTLDNGRQIEALVYVYLQETDTGKKISKQHQPWRIRK